MNSIKARIQEGKHDQQAFAVQCDNSLEIARVLVAFANTNGGRLLIGLKDNGKITGILPAEELKRIDEIAKYQCQPAVRFTTHEWQEDFKLLLEIDVAPNTNRFVTAKDEEGEWKSYIRVKSETLKANKIQLKLWKLKQQSIERPTVFKERELACFNTISNQLEAVNLSKLYKLLDFYSKKDVDDSLAILIHWKMVDWQFEEGVFKYFTTKY